MRIRVAGLDAAVGLVGAPAKIALETPDLAHIAVNFDDQIIREASSLMETVDVLRDTSDESVRCREPNDGFVCSVGFGGAKR